MIQTNPGACNLGPIFISGRGKEKLSCITQANNANSKWDLTLLFEDTLAVSVFSGPDEAFCLPGMRTRDTWEKTACEVDMCRGSSMARIGTPGQKSTPNSIASPTCARFPFCMLPFSNLLSRIHSAHANVLN